jgi:hypothetical protein
LPDQRAADGGQLEEHVDEYPQVALVHEPATSHDVLDIFGEGVVQAELAAAFLVQAALFVGAADGVVRYLPGSLRSLLIGQGWIERDAGEVLGEFTENLFEIADGVTEDA